MNKTSSQNIDSGTIFGDGVAALLPHMIGPLLTAYEAHRENPDMARFSGFSGATEPLYQVSQGGVANISCSGMLMQRPGLLMRIFFGASDLVELRNAIAAAAEDKAVKAIILSIDSPGGVVNGPPEIASLIEEVCRVKPVVAWSDGVIASAAYWIASACTSVYVSGPTVITGSIGVVATHTYAPSTDGRTTTEIAAGKFKRIASSNAPLTPEGHAHLQERINYLADVFHQSVARGRGMSPAQIAGLEAATYIGQQGIEAGLVDGVVSFNALASDLARDPARYMRRRQAVRKGAATATFATAGVPVATSSAPVTQAYVPPPAAVATPAPTLAEQKTEAAQCLVKAYAIHGRDFRIRVQPMASWHAEAKYETEKDGCDLPTALLRVGFVHALISLPPVAPPKAAPAAVHPAPGSASVRTGLVEPRYRDSPPFSKQDKEAAGKAFSAAHAKDESFRVRMNTAETWNKLAEHRASRDGCDFETALQREGFVHPAISVAPSSR